ncbi:MAG: DNA mismatch repair protein MutS, partial [Candidatus Omnitrophica bacterium]|nr:DNA mismatch repair protein MutS [Candidatus Omnitrophota bacterium]
MTTTEPIHGDVTPMMHQYLQIKREYRDAILFFRLGDFYEMFFDDAKIASALLGLALTSREAGKDNRVPMCGIPYHAAETYIARLIAAAHKVAICEQVEDPKQAKGIVKRDIIRVVTPSTIMGQAALLQHQNNYLVSVYQRSSHEYGVAAADVSTGEFKLTELDREEKMLSELTRLAPAEILLSAGITGNPALLGKIKQRVAAAISEVEEWTFDYSHSYERLTAHFKTQTLRGFGCEEMPLAISAAGAALRYLEHTQKTDLAHIAALTPYALNKFMVLDSIAQRNLELVRTLRGDKKATLLAELNFTRTAMGSRLIQHWIQQPLIDIAEINARLDAVAELLAQPALRTQLHETLKPVADIERLLGRISVGIANARDVHALNQSLKIIPGLKTILGPACSPLLSDTREALCECAELAGRIDATIREDAPLSVREGRMIRPGADKELDELLRISNGGKEWIAALQQREISRTGINSLKIKYNRVFGYYIE